MTQEIREVREDDLPFLAANLRSADIRELIAVYGKPDFLGSLRRSADLSDQTLVGCPAPGEKPVMLFGIRKVTPKNALIWACATVDLVDNRMAFLRASRPIIKRWFEERPSVDTFTNFTHAKNFDHHRWLRWCGAELLPARRLGPRGEPFLPFIIRRQKYHV